uniref:Uncharacterized protein n=1 Tax=Zea mays TaxID=4577 RepID=C4J856_MAIZE|nr:unknown [Zea mays]
MSSHRCSAIYLANVSLSPAASGLS